MAERLETICIVCPNGCRLTAVRKGNVIEVSGNKCPRGITYAEAEMTAPKRSFTGTVASVFKEMPVVPVRTAGEVDKDKILEIAARTREIFLTRAYAAGEVAEENVCGTGVALIVTTDMRKVTGRTEEL